MEFICNQQKAPPTKKTNKKPIQSNNKPCTEIGP